MKTTRLLTVFVVLTLAVSAGAKSISEQLKAADCDFIVQFKSKDVNVLDQKITLRAVSDREETVASDATPHISGTGYRAYHLEIAYSGHNYIDVPYAIRTIEFLNDKRKIIHTLSIAKPSRAKSESEKNKKLYVRYLAINLETIPLVLLDDVVYVNFKP